MTLEEIKKVHTNNLNGAWKKGYDAALLRFLNEGDDYHTAATKADDILFQLNWDLANPPE